MTKKPQSTHAACATAIRQELGTLYPKVKFSVRSSSFAGGNSVDVDWTDGPTEPEINAIIGKYQYGKFDGMQDMYEYTNSRKDIPQTKYVQTHRNQSAETKMILLPVAELIFLEHDYGCLDAHNLLHRIFYKTSLPGGAKITGIEENKECTAGDVYDFFKIVYEVPETEPVQEVIAGSVEIVDYSEKAIAVMGDTKPIKETLFKLGGRFNAHLRGGAGWIFPKTKESNVRAALGY